MIDVKEIMQILPHRYPFLLVDRIESLKEGEEIVGIKNVSINEPFFVGHFPGNPIMPGVLIIEAMAQVGGVLAFHSSPKEWAGSLVYFMGIDKVRFRKPVVMVTGRVEMFRRIYFITTRICLNSPRIPGWSMDPIKSPRQCA